MALPLISATFPKRIGFGARSEGGWSTGQTETIGGFISTNEQWEDALHVFDVSLAVRKRSDYMEVRAHHHMARGRARAFLFLDSLDYEVTATEGVTADTGDSPFALQMFRRYGSGNDLYDRRITRPKQGTITIYRTRGGNTTDVTGSATIDYGGASTDLPGGTFTVTGHVGGDTYTWAGQFWVPCHYGVDQLPTVIVERNPGADGQLLVACEAIPVLEVRE